MISEHIFEHYLNSLMDGDRQQCTAIVEDLLRSNVGLKDLYIQLFQASLYRVGELWERNVISVATEHLATSITEGLLGLAYPYIFAAPHIGKKAIISCVANEFHQIGGKMVADIFELHGWDGYFLGANTPPDGLLKLIDTKKPDLVGLSLAVYTNFDNLVKVVEMVRANFRDLRILVGGQAFLWGGYDQVLKHGEVIYLPTLEDLERTIHELAE